MEDNCTSYSVSFMYKFSPGMIMTSVALGLINLTVLLGNSLVITAVIQNRKLRTVTNIYIVSLACADMMLAVLVLPFSAALEVLDFWPFGEGFCSMWLAIDVLLCTASILNLCAISMDRYLAVTKPIKYPSIMSKRKGKIIVLFVWILSFVISLPPLIGWNGNDENNGVSKQYEYQYTSHLEYDNHTKPTLRNDTLCIKQYPQCELTPTRGYRIFSALGSFYVPMFVMMFFYLQIYRAAIRTAASLRTGVLLTKRSDEFPNSKCMKMDTITLRVHRGGNSLSRSPSSVSNHRRTSYMTNSNREEKLQERGDIEVLNPRQQPIQCLNNNKRSLAHNNSEPDLRNGGGSRSKYHNAELVEDSMSYLLNSNSSRHACPESPFQSRKSPPRCLRQSIRNGMQRSIVFINDGQSKQKINIRKFLKETKAAKTVAIIVGAFIVCWFPFFTIYLIGAFCPDCVPHVAFSILFWLGYCNSVLNPFIYALFSRDFRSAFRKILKCKKLYRPAIFSRSNTGTNNKRPYGVPIMESESFSDF